jgi:uncharacterized membrane protein YdbT with pleckstrin-like domain
MTSYIDNTLSADERILLDTKISLRPHIVRFVVGAFFLLGAITTFMMPSSATPMGYAIAMALIALLFIAPPILRYFTSELALTNKRVVSRFGIISISTLEIRLDKIESVSVNQSILGRILGYGSVVVRGTGGSRDTLPNVPNPVNFRARFAQALEGYAS